MRTIVAEAVADNLGAPANTHVQEQATNKALKRPSPEREQIDSDSEKTSRRTTSDNLDRESTPEWTISRRGEVKM